LTSLVELLLMGVAAEKIVSALAGLPGVLPDAAAAVLRLPEMSTLRSPAEAVAPDPVRATNRINAIRRAQYLVKAARRVSEAGLREGLPKEAVYFQAHRRASENRRMAAQTVAQAQERFGPELGWYATMDSRTSPDCRAANGKNFRAARPPRIGFPGSVHPNCRCKPGPPHQRNRADSAGVRGGQEMAAVNKYEDTRLVELAKQSGSLNQVAAHLGVSRVSLTNYLLRRPNLDRAVRAVLTSRARPPELLVLATGTQSSAYPKLERVPGKQNWVDKSGGLPSYIERIAKHLHYEKGMDISRAIAVAVNTVKRWAAGGTVTEHGTTKTITAKTQAQAAAALAQWEAKKAASHSHANRGGRALELATASEAQLNSYYKAPPPSSQKKKGGAAPAAPSSGKKKVVRTAAGASRYKVPIGSEIGSARNADAAKAQQNKAATDRYKSVVGAKDRDAQVKSLNNDDLGQLSQVAFSFKSSDPNVVALRSSVIAQMRARGMNPNQFGYLGGNGPAKPAAKPAVKPRVVAKAPVKKPAPAPVRAPGSLKLK
jgi:SPP1 gp7 family putative phage head morphogenesis protein